MKIAAVSELPSGFSSLTRRTVKAMHSDTGDTISAINTRQLRAVFSSHISGTMQNRLDKDSYQQPPDPEYPGCSLPSFSGLAVREAAGHLS